MAACLYVQGIILRHLRAAVGALSGKPGESGQDIQLGYDPAVCLDRRDILADKLHEVGIQLRLEGIDAVLGAEDLCLVFLQLFSDVTFGADQGLLADPFRWHKVLESVPYFDVIAEHIVEADLQG